MVDHIDDASEPRGRGDIRVGVGRRRRWSVATKGARVGGLEPTNARARIGRPPFRERPGRALPNPEEYPACHGITFPVGSDVNALAELCCHLVTRDLSRKMRTDFGIGFAHMVDHIDDASEPRGRVDIRVGVGRPASLERRDQGASVAE